MRIFYLLIFLASCLLWANMAVAGKRLALVIGNSSYTKTSPLENAENDARLIQRSLQQVGFTVKLVPNATRAQMSRAVAEYFKALEQSGADSVGLVYYAGHGVQVRGKNYLIPVDADISHELDIPGQAYSASDLLNGMRIAGNKMNIVIFDACRNNPYRSSFRAQGRGLAKMDAPKGSFIAFSTSPGSVAEDGLGRRNSPFSQALAQYIKTPGLTLEQVIKRVGLRVSQQTRGRQSPWFNSSVYLDFYFLPRVKQQAITASTKRDECDVPDKPLRCLGIR